MGDTKKILVADDSPAIQKIASSILAGENVQIITVANGIAAIKKYALEMPQVVLADIEMPGKDGYEVCDHIKKTPDTEQTMVLLVVGEMDQFDENRAKQVKADGVVKKPFNVRELFDMVHGHLEKISQAADVAPPPMPEASSAAPPSEPDSAPAEAGTSEPEPDLEPPKAPELDFSNLKEPMALGEIPMDYPEESPASEPAPVAATEEKKAPVFDLAAALGDLDIPALASQAEQASSEKASKQGVGTEVAANPPTADAEAKAPTKDSASAAILDAMLANPKPKAPASAQNESKPESKPAGPAKDAASAAILGAVAAKPKAPVPAPKESKPDSMPAVPAGKAETPKAAPVAPTVPAGKAETPKAAPVTPTVPAGKAETPKAAPVAPAVDASMIQAVVEKAIASSTNTGAGGFDSKAVHSTVEKALEALLAPKMAKEVAERITSELAKQLKDKK